MAAKNSTMRPLGTPAAAFELHDVDGRVVRLEDHAAAPALLVAFICNHCPFVIHIRDAFAAMTARYAPRGLATVAINANDADAYPADAPERMREVAQQCRFGFPYLFDATQEVAKAYGAVCTPDFFLYDGQRRLVYRGQFDDSRPGNGIAPDGADLGAAVEAVLRGAAPATAQKPSVGCSIKWRAGNAPDYAG